MSDDVSEARRRIDSLRNRISTSTPGRPGTPQLPFSTSDPQAGPWRDVLAALDDMEKRITELERKPAQ